MGAIPRCRVEPMADDQVAFWIDATERLRWRFGSNAPRPFFYPWIGPSGAGLTRMGHPGAPDHDHHRSIWFAHNAVSGVDFWGDRSGARVRQTGWLAYEDSDEEARMAVTLGWFDGHDPAALMEQTLIASVRPGPEAGETVIELDAEFRPTARTLELGRTNFGFLAVRVAKSISERFGGGRLTSSEGGTGEPALFEKPARWMDYSGPVAAENDPRRTTTEGIAYFDHPSNPGAPSDWHVRSDGWMGASVCRRGPLTIAADRPLRLRYALWAHRGGCDRDRMERMAESFARAPRREAVRVEGDAHTRHVIRAAAT